MTSDDSASVGSVPWDGTAITDNDFTDGIAVPSLLAGDHENENGGETMCLSHK